MFHEAALTYPIEARTTLSASAVVRQRCFVGRNAQRNNGESTHGLKASVVVPQAAVCTVLHRCRGRSVENAVDLATGRNRGQLGGDGAMSLFW
jgi:hypothetical protein